MSDAPERIWARKHPAKYSGHWHDATHDKGVADVANSALGTINPFVEYIRADKVAALVVAASDLMQRLDTTRGTGRITPSVETVLDRLDAALAAFKGGADGR